jgi:hypothetical protein
MQPKKPVSQPAHKSVTLQPKTSGSSQTRKPPAAPPAYRPQPVPKVLQTKSATGQPANTGQAPRQSAAPRPIVAPPVHGPQQKRLVQPKTAEPAQAHTPPNAPPVYRPQHAPKVLQAKNSQAGAAAAVSGPQQQLPQKARTITATYNLARPARATGGGVVQARLSMDAVGNLDYNGDPVGPNLNDPDVESLIDSLEDDYDFTASQIRKVEKVIETEPLYNFRGPEHLKRYVKGKDDPPSLVHDDEGATMLDDISDQFGSTFKIKGVPFSGSRVYALAHSEGATEVWAMQNSATGYITKGNQNIVNTWQLPELKMPITFPSNTKRVTDKANLKRPTVMASNAHAEVNEIIQHAYRSLEELHAHPHNVGLMFASDIQHCAECYWAAQAMWKKGNKVPFNATGCGNRLFARWREPWKGFYTEYGDNPFRKPNGDLRGNLTVGEYQPHVLNARVSGTLGNIYK